MLDIETIVEPTDTALDIVSVADMKKHLRISASITASDDTIEEAIIDAVDKLDGPRGELNRTLRPRTYRRYMTNYPGDDAAGNPLPIPLPFGDLIEVLAVTTEDGSSPDNNLTVTTDYVVKSGMLVPEIHPVTEWPSIDSAPRAISVTYRAGYETYPGALKRMIKILASHYLENTEATIREQSKTEIPRRVLFAMDDLRAQFRIPVSYDDWNE